MRISLGGFILAVGITGALIQSWMPHRGRSVSFVQVGQGDCSLIQVDDFTMVIDTGAQFEGHDKGGRLALPFLRSQGVHKIDLMVLTHPDMDHVGGLKAFVRRYAIGTICMPARFASDLSTQRWLAECGVSPSQVKWINQQVEFMVRDVAFRIQPTPFGNDYPDNDGSMVVSARFPRARFLFTGDGSATLEQWLMTVDNVKSTVLKAGHHGSRSSSDPAFLAAVAPTYVVLSCGRNNHYGHPSPAVLQRLGQVDATIYRTDRDGDITYWLEGDLKITHQRP